MLPKTQALIEYLLMKAETGMWFPFGSEPFRLAEAAKWEMMEAGHWHESPATAEGE